MALTTARLAGDGALIARALAEAESIPSERFSSYPLAAIAFERARLAVAADDPGAGPLLWDAFGKLQAHGERRAAATCRRELGSWRLRQGDRDGVVDLAVAALELLTVDPPAAAVALVRLAGVVESSAALGLSGEADPLRAAAAALTRSGAGLPLEPGELAEVEGAVGERPTPEDRHDESWLREILGRLARATTL